MKKIFLLLIPLFLFISCDLEPSVERGNFKIFNHTPSYLIISLECKYEKPYYGYLNSTAECTNYPINCDYTLKIKKREQDKFTVFKFHPTYEITQYSIVGDDGVYLLFSSNPDEKIEKISK